ncbi:PIN domain-containing protein [Herbiconiux sp. P18]|uniref:PIN domain-containing protein n=1 Tax=Herbiconiux liangxiaofengii TaxID=3342795 RepID=UPI0035B86AE8
MTWEFLRTGVTQAVAEGRLTSLLLGLTKVGERSPSILDIPSSPEMWTLLGDPSHIATSYMMWVEDAEETLALIYEDRNVAQRLHTERYWRIRDIEPDNTGRPTEMVVAEREYQAHRLNGLLSQLQEFAAALSYGRDESFLMLDTNVLVHGKLFTEVDWTQFTGYGSASILLPLAVIDELDKLKDSGRAGPSEKARATLRELHKVISGSTSPDAYVVRPSVALRLVTEPRNHHRLSRVDDEIIRQATYFNALTENRVKLVTRDRGMSVRASYASLSCEMFPPELERSQPQGGSGA